MAKTVEKKPTPEKTYSEAQVKGLIAAAVAEAMKKQGDSKVYSIVPEEKVTLLFIGAIAKGTEVCLGEIGKITRDGGVLEVPKKDFFQKMNATVESLLEDRKLLVIDGVTDEEKERYNLCYGDNDVLTAQSYRKILDYDTETLCDIFSRLCEQHRKIVTKVFFGAYASGDARVTLQKCQELNRISKETDKVGLFTEILKDMGKKLGE